MGMERVCYPQIIGKQQFPRKIDFQNIVHQVRDGNIFMGDVRVKYFFCFIRESWECIHGNGESMLSSDYWKATVSQKDRLPEYCASSERWQYICGRCKSEIFFLFHQRKLGVYPWEWREYVILRLLESNSFPER